MIDLMKNLKTDVVEKPQTELKPALVGGARVSSEFEALFLEHWAPMYRLLCRLVGDPAEAEDLALETFIRLYQKGPEHQGEFNRGGWLRRVATNLGLHSIRGWKRREHYEMTAGKYALEEAADSPAEIMTRNEEHRMARLAL